ncbi:MAG: ATP-binding protein [Spirochaetia bacterium]|nr:ATP-binding protein [Spirochaetia bacterium]
MEKLTLEIHSFPPIADAAITLGDLSFVVGPQAMGKSYLLQSYFLAENHKYVNRTLRQAGYRWEKEAGKFMEAFFGQGMKSYDARETRIILGGKAFDPTGALDPVSDGGKIARTFYIPAQRVLVFEDGWPRAFDSFNSTYPFVVKDFSAKVLKILELGPGSKGAAVFPQEKRIKSDIRHALDAQIFHGAEIRIEIKDLKNRLILRSGNNELPIMTWSTGQREFTPLLLGLYHLMPPSGASKKGDIDTIIIEEPETGLHPRAIRSVMLTLLELVVRGYRVVVSTHSPDVLHYAWALAFFGRRMRDGASRDGLVSIVRKLAGAGREDCADLLQKDVRVYFAKPGVKGSVFKDISSLDAFSDDPDIAEWGGIAAMANDVQELVVEAANL